MSDLLIEKKAPEIKAMFAGIAKRYDLINTVLSFGIHKIWKRILIRQAASLQAKQVLDLCTGTGDLLPGLAQVVDQVVGADFCPAMLDEAQAKIKNFDNIKIQVADALNLNFSDQVFDLVTIAFGVRNFEKLDRGLTEVQRVLQPGGTILILEFGQPNNKLFAVCYKIYSTVFLPLVGRILAGNSKAYSYLKTSAASFPCREEFLKQLEHAHFINCQYFPLSGGIAYIYKAQTLREN